MEPAEVGRDYATPVFEPGHLEGAFQGHVNVIPQENRAFVQKLAAALQPDRKGVNVIAESVRLV